MMVVSRPYGNASDVYTWKLMMQIMLNSKNAGEARFTRIRKSVRGVYMEINYSNNG